MKVAIIGAHGYVGSALTNHLLILPEYQVTAVTRANYNVCKEEDYDVLIHSAMPSKRWWAWNNPMKDFEQSVGLTADILYNWKFKKFVLISSVSARIQPDHPYGIHKAAAELIVKQRSEHNLIIRLGGLYGHGLSKGVIFDMIEGNDIFMTSDSAFNYIDTSIAAKLIAQRLDQNGLIEVGARDTITIGQIADHFKLKVAFGERYEYQNTEHPEADYPSAFDILDFVEKTINA